MSIIILTYINFIHLDIYAIIDTQKDSHIERKKLDIGTKSIDCQ
ncbi:MAG: hypothetical protein BAJALOKI3v1_450021 [Promethearchaeota archaeon]|nr:MAG: hypothetical protein BAJALOKI3v1_450021 [Candidatus Lokiarchaeota archaeon]